MIAAVAGAGGFHGRVPDYHTYAVSPDGQRFLIPRPESAVDAEATPAPITVVVNWTRALTR